MYVSIYTPPVCIMPINKVSLISFTHCRANIADPADLYKQIPSARNLTISTSAELIFSEPYKQHMTHGLPGTTIVFTIHMHKKEMKAHWVTLQ